MEQFISEPLHPLAESADAAAMSRGEPGLPARFRWRDQEHAVRRVVRTWKTSSRDRGELYLRRHWFEIETDRGARMTVYCERQARQRDRPKGRWWIYTLSG